MNLNSDPGFLPNQLWSNAGRFCMALKVVWFTIRSSSFSLTGLLTKDAIFSIVFRASWRNITSHVIWFSVSLYSLTVCLSVSSLPYRFKTEGSSFLLFCPSVSFCPSFFFCLPLLFLFLSLYCMSHFRALWLVQTRSLVLTKRAYLYSFVLTFFRSSYLMVRMFGSCLCFHHSRVYSNQQP